MTPAREITVRAINPWLLVAFTALMQAFTIGIASYAFALFVLPWMSEFGASRSDLMLAPTGYAIGMALLSPFGGLILDRVDNRLLVVIGALIYVCALGLLAFANGAWAIVAIFLILIPLAVNFTGPLMAFALVARHVHENRGLALGITALGTSAGGLLMPLLVSHLLQTFDWREVFDMLAIAVLLCVALPAWPLLRRVGCGAYSGNSTSLSSSLALMRSRPVLLLGMSQLLPVSLFGAVLYSLGVYAPEIGLSQQHAAWTIALASAAMACGKVLAGAAGERVQPRTLYLGMLVAIAVAMLLIAEAGAFGVLATGVGLLALMIGGIVPLIAACIARYWPMEKFGSVMGVVQALGSLSAAGSYIAATLRDTAGSYPLAFIGMTLLLVPAAGCFLWMLTLTTRAKVSAGH